MHKVGEIQATHTYTASSIPIAAVANANQKSARERDSICTWVRWRQAVASPD